VAELARGSLADRPWGRTLGALALRGLSGQVDVSSDGKTYSIAFVRGAVFNAASPLANDSAVRVAVTGNLVSPTQVSEIGRRIAADPKRDEIDVIGELARLSPEQVQRLRRRTIAQRAARTFAVDHGDFVVVDRATLPQLPGNELDVRGIIYLAARTTLAETRLGNELARMGTWFRLKPDAAADVPQFGFGEAEQPVLERLGAGAAMSDLLAAAPTLNAQSVRAIVYALASVGACDTTSPPEASDAIDPPTVMRRSPSEQVEIEAPTAKPKRPPTEPGTPIVANKPVAPAPPSVVKPATPAQPAPPRPPRAGPQQPRAQTAAGNEIQRLVAELVTQLDRGVDHFALLGVPFGAPEDAVRSAYFALARKLHPDRLAAIGVDDAKRDAQRLFAQINAAFAVLSDPARREDYIAMVKRGGEAAVRADDKKAEELAARVMQAEEAFRMGEMALRRDQLAQAVAAFTTAVELQPHESEYQALLAWARFASATDKNALASPTRTALQRATEANAKSPTARFYLGRVERMLGKEKEALAHFQEVLRIKPGHAEAASEARLLEQRLRGKR
jgi:hypothetical protein